MIGSIAKCDAPRVAIPFSWSHPWATILTPRLYTQSKFLLLHPEPTRMLNSQLNDVRTMLASRNAYLAMLAPRYGLLFRRPLTLYPTRWLFAPGHGPGARLLARGVRTAVWSAARDRAELASVDCFDVRYEDLCVRPNETLAGILGWLGLDNSSVPDVSTMIAPRGGELLPEVEHLRPAFAARLNEFYRKFGYAASS